MLIENRRFLITHLHLVPIGMNDPIGITSNVLHQKLETLATVER